MAKSCDFTKINRFRIVRQYNGILELLLIFQKSHRILTKTHSISGLESLETTIFGLKIMVKSGLDILKFYKALQSCCSPVQKKALPRKVELA